MGTLADALRGGGAMNAFLSMTLLLLLYASPQEVEFVEEWSVRIPRFNESSVLRSFMGGDGQLYLYEVQLTRGLLTGPGRLVVISPQGRVVRTLESPFFSSLAIAVDRRGHIYLWQMEGNRSRIRIFSPEMAPIRTIETPTLHPELLLVDDAGNIYAVGPHVHSGQEARFEHLDGTIVHVFAQDGREIAAFGSWDASLPLDRRVRAMSRSLLALSRGRLLLYPNRPVPPDRFVSPLHIFTFDGDAPRVEATFDLRTLPAPARAARSEVQRSLLSESDFVEGVGIWHDRVAVNIMRRTPAGTFQSLVVLISPSGQMVEVPVPAPERGRLIGVDPQGNFYFEYRPSGRIVKARLVER